MPGRARCVVNAFRVGIARLESHFPAERYLWSAALAVCPGTAFGQRETTLGKVHACALSGEDTAHTCFPFWTAERISPRRHHATWPHTGRRTDSRCRS